MTLICRLVCGLLPIGIPTWLWPTSRVSDCASNSSSIYDVVDTAVGVSPCFDAHDDGVAGVITTKPFRIDPAHLELNVDAPPVPPPKEFQNRGNARCKTPLLLRSTTDRACVPWNGAEAANGLFLVRFQGISAPWGRVETAHRRRALITKALCLRRLSVCGEAKMTRSGNPLE